MEEKKTELKMIKMSEDRVALVSIHPLWKADNRTR